MWKAERLRLSLPRLDLWFAFSDDPSGRFPDIRPGQLGAYVRLFECVYHETWQFAHPDTNHTWCDFVSLTASWCPKSHVWPSLSPPLPSSPSALGLTVSCGYHVPSESSGSNGARFSCFGMLLSDFTPLCCEESGVIYEHNISAFDIFSFPFLFPYFADLLIAIKSCTCVSRVSPPFLQGYCNFFLGSLSESVGTVTKKIDHVFDLQGTEHISKTVARSFEKKQLHTQHSTFNSGGRRANYAIRILPHNIT